MAPQMTPLFRLLTPLLHNMRTTKFSPQKAQNILESIPKRAFSSTPTSMAPPKKGPAKRDPRITLIRYHMQHPITPRPLRFSRTRALRHWTIHRAWMLFRRKQRDAETLELERLHNSIHGAMECLRTLDGPGQINGGRLYRVATEKKGIYGPSGIPIEYARQMVDTPGSAPWNHDWKR